MKIMLKHHLTKGIDKERHILPMGQISHSADWYVLVDTGFLKTGQKIAKISKAPFLGFSPNLLV